MKVRQRLKVNALILVMTALGVCAIISVALYRLDRANSVAKTVGDIILRSFERVTFRNDFLWHNSERARVQWFAAQDELDRIMETARREFPSAGDKGLIDEMGRNDEGIRKIFSAVVDNRKETTASGDGAVISREVEDRLLSQLNMKVYQNVLYGRELLESSRAARAAIIRQTAFAIAVLFVLLLAVVLFNAWTTGRAIADRIRALSEGASVIGGGDLSHRILIDSDDEFSALSRTFNEMTEKLQASYQDLEREITERKEAESEVLKLSEDMAARNVELEHANRELESFVYSVSHDLRAPLRSISGFTKIIMSDYAGKFDEQGRDYMVRVVKGAEKMSQLIDAMLNLSRISRQDLAPTSVDLSALAASVIADLREHQPDREVDVRIAPGMSAKADPRLMELALMNLLENAWKFTAKTPGARIEFGMGPPVPPSHGPVYCVKDNGVGFDMNYADKMFLPFHRLHPATEYEGAGVGLSIVERIIRRHGGRVWAEGGPGAGAVVYFTLG